MKKEETKKVNDPVGEYLVNRINELEEQLKNEKLYSTKLLCYADELEEKAGKFEELQSLFRVENNVVCLYDKGNHFQDAVATDWTDFGKYLVKLLELKEKE